jgi:thiamine kinase-like enzyme
VTGTHHAACLSFSPTTRELALRLAQMCSPHVDAGERLGAGDLVHGDLATDNVLADGDRLTIIDSQDVGRGTRVIDLATMAVHCLAWDESPLAVAPFLARTIAVGGAGAARICASARALIAVVHAIEHYPDFADTLASRLLDLPARLNAQIHRSSGT